MMWSLGILARMIYLGRAPQYHDSRGWRSSVAVLVMFKHRELSIIRTGGGGSGIWFSQAYTRISR